MHSTSQRYLKEKDKHCIYIYRYIATVLDIKTNFLDISLEHLQSMRVVNLNNVNAVIAQSLSKNIKKHIPVVDFVQSNFTRQCLND